MKTTALAATILLLLLGACGTKETAPPTPEGSLTMNPTETEAARTALVEWFECEECEEGQLAAVAKYGQKVVPSLRAALLEGASPASEELLRRGLEKRYDELLRYSETHRNSKPASTKEQFVALYLGNFHAQYRVRAAQALSAIGGPDALAALEEGLKRAERPDVRSTVETELKKLQSKP